MKDTEDIIEIDLEEENTESETGSDDIEEDASSLPEEDSNDAPEEQVEEKADIREIIKSFQPLDYFDYVNLHIHSKYSDGKADFEDIIRQAKEMGGSRKKNRPEVRSITGRRTRQYCTVMNERS